MADHGEGDRPGPLLPGGVGAVGGWFASWAVGEGKLWFLLLAVVFLVLGLAAIQVESLRQQRTWFRMTLAAGALAFIAALGGLAFAGEVVPWWAAAGIAAVVILAAVIADLEDHLGALALLGLAGFFLGSVAVSLGRQDYAIAAAGLGIAIAAGSTGAVLLTRRPIVAQLLAAGAAVFVIAAGINALHDPNSRPVAIGLIATGTAGLIATVIFRRHADRLAGTALAGLGILLGLVAIDVLNQGRYDQAMIAIGAGLVAWGASRAVRQQHLANAIVLAGCGLAALGVPPINADRTPSVVAGVVLLAGSLLAATAPDGRWRLSWPARLLRRTWRDAAKTYAELRTIDLDEEDRPADLDRAPGPGQPDEQLTR
jgi:hypothetical protein